MALGIENGARVRGFQECSKETAVLSIGKFAYAKQNIFMCPCLEDDMPQDGVRDHLSC